MKLSVDALLGRHTEPDPALAGQDPVLRGLAAADRVLGSAAVLCGMAALVIVGVYVIGAADPKPTPEPEKDDEAEAIRLLLAREDTERMRRAEDEEMAFAL